MDILYNDGGIGDAILLSAVAENAGHAVACTRYNCILQNNPALTIFESSAAEALLPGPMASLLRKNGFFPRYVHYWDLEERQAGRYHWVFPSVHQIAKNCSRAGVYGDIKIRPRICLTEHEKERGQVFSKRQIAIQSTGAAWKTPGFAVYKSIVEHLRSNFNFVQIGEASDTPLPYATNLCGKISLRETAAVLAASDAFIGHIGGPMHMARAVDTRSVIAFSGSEPLHFSSYVANENISSTERCELCTTNSTGMFNGDTCPNEYRCVKTICSEALIEGLFRLLQRDPERLEVQMVNNETEKETITPRLLYYRTSRMRPTPSGFSKQMC